MTFKQKLHTTMTKNNSLVCVGLDSDWEKLPASIKNTDYPLFEFNKKIVETTHDFVCAYKPNSAFYEYLGSEGVRQLKLTCDYIRETYPDIPLILDAKRADIGSTNKGYVSYAFDYLGVDAITLNPYLGKEALVPFLEIKDKACIILCRTSNSGAGELQDQIVNGRPLYQLVAEKVAKEWNKNDNCMLVVGATYPEELRQVREIVGDMTLLIPGIGVQGGDVEKTIQAGLNSKNGGMIINSSRGIIFAQNPRAEAKKLCDEINKYRKNVIGEK